MKITLTELEASRCVAALVSKWDACKDREEAEEYLKLGRRISQGKLCAFGAAYRNPRTPDSDPFAVTPEELS